jgi:hypothetical protein
MGGTNLQCRPIIWYGVCCFGLANRGDTLNYSLSIAISVHGNLDLNNVSLQQSTASYNAAARLASATPPPAHILSRGIGWQVNIIFEPWLIISCSECYSKLKSNYLKSRLNNNTL